MASPKNNTGKKYQKKYPTAGRPKVELDRHNFEHLCLLNPAMVEIEAFFDCSEEAIYKWCKRTYGKPFHEVYEIYKAKGDTSLRRKQTEIAMKGDRTMLIWLGKNRLKQADKIEVKQKEFLDQMSDEDLLDLANKVLKKK